MRIHEGNFAYDVEPVWDPRTLVRTGWKYRVFAMRPEREIAAGEAQTREEAEEEARRMVEKTKRQEQHKVT